MSESYGRDEFVKEVAANAEPATEPNEKRVRDLLRRANAELNEELEDAAVEVLKKHLLEVRVTRNLLDRMEKLLASLLDCPLESIAVIPESLFASLGE